MFFTRQLRSASFQLNKTISQQQTTIIRNWYAKAKGEQPTGSKRPATAILLGWATSIEKTDRKYASLYLKRGIDSIMCTPPYTTTFHDVKNAREVGELAQAIAQLPKDERFLIHLNSHHAAMTLGSLLMQHPELRVLERTAGMLFDSCPIPPFFMHTFPLSYVYDQIFFYNVFHSPERPSMLTYLIWKSYALLMFAVKTALVQTAAKLGFDVRKYNCYEYLVTHPKIPPLVALAYSDADIVCPSRYIEEFGQRLRKRGVKVMELHLKDVPHILIYRNRTEQYAAFVNDFITASLEGPNSTK